MPWRAWAHVLGDVPWPALPTAVRGFSGSLANLLLDSPVTGEVFTAAVRTVEPGGRVALTLHRCNICPDSAPHDPRSWEEEEEALDLRRSWRYRRSAVLVEEDCRGFLDCYQRMRYMVCPEWNPVPDLVPPVRPALVESQVRHFLLAQEMDGEHNNDDEYDSDC